MSSSLDNNSVWGSYFTQIPNIARDELNLYERDLFGHYMRVAGACGQCYQSIRTIAKACDMSPAKVIEARDNLVKKGYIIVERAGNARNTGVIRINYNALYERNQRAGQASKHAQKTEVLRNVNTPQAEECSPNLTLCSPGLTEEDVLKEEKDKEESKSAKNLPTYPSPPAPKKRRPKGPVDLGEPAAYRQPELPTVVHFLNSYLNPSAQFHPDRSNWDTLFGRNFTYQDREGKEHDLGPLDEAYDKYHYVRSWVKDKTEWAAKKFPEHNATRRKTMLRYIFATSGAKYRMDDWRAKHMSDADKIAAYAGKIVFAGHETGLSPLEKAVAKANARKEEAARLSKEQQEKTNDE